MWSRRLSCLSSPLPLPLPLCAVVFGVVRAQLCEHARYPRTPLCSLFLLFAFSSLLFFSAPRLSSTHRLSIIGMAVGVSPCVGLLCGHDSNRESVPFVLVLLVVACSAFASSAVAASAVAFGAEDAPVVRMVGSA